MFILAVFTLLLADVVAPRPAATGSPAPSCASIEAALQSDPLFAYARKQRGEPRCKFNVSEGQQVTFTFPGGATYVTTRAGEIFTATLKVSGLTEAGAIELAKKVAAQQGLSIDFTKPRKSDDRTSWWDPDCNCHVAVLYENGKIVGLDFGMAL